MYKRQDFTHYRLTRPDGTPGQDTEIITWLDDHSRYALHLGAHPQITAPIVLRTFTTAAGLYGYPASTLIDNGMVYTVRFPGCQGPGSMEVPLSRVDRCRRVLHRLELVVVVGLVLDGWDEAEFTV